MKIVLAYNHYRTSGHGEDRVVEQTQRLLASRGITPVMLEAHSATITSPLQRLHAAMTTHYRAASARRTAALIAAHRPDVLHAHNLYPLLTPAVLTAARRDGVPTVVTAHSFFLTCPIATHLAPDDRTCTACLPGAEYHCVTRNCRRNLAESVIYAMRSRIARGFRLFVANTNVFIALSDFARSLLIAAGYPAQRIVVLPNAVPLPADRAAHGSYIAFAGRLTRAKGIDVLIDAAQRTGLPMRIAGNPADAEMPRPLPDNVTCVGMLTPPQMDEFYRGARMVVVPSRWFEMCPLVVLEAMSHGLPVVASRLGSIPELVVDGVTGVLIAPGDAAALAQRMQHLWDDPAASRQMGEAGRQRIASEFNENDYTDRLLAIYRRAVELGPPQ